MSSLICFTIRDDKMIPPIFLNPASESLEQDFVMGLISPFHPFMTDIVITCLKPVNQQQNLTHQGAAKPAGSDIGLSELLQSFPVRRTTTEDFIRYCIGIPRSSWYDKKRGSGSAVGRLVQPAAGSQLPVS